MLVVIGNQGNKNVEKSYVILQTMSLFKRYRFFLVAAFVVAAFSLLILFRYSAIANVNVKLTGSAELGLKYLNDLKDKFSHESKTSESRNKRLDSVGEKAETGPKNVVSSSNALEDIDKLVSSSLEKNSKKKPVSVEKDIDLKTEATLKLTTEVVKDIVWKTMTVPTTLLTSTELSTTTKLTTTLPPTTSPPTREKEVESQKEDNSESEVKNEETDDLELCPKKPTNLVGPLYVDQKVPKMEDLNKHLSASYGGWVLNGGAWRPTECKARTKMALIIPYRNRYEQLGIFVRHMHPMLKRQNVEYRIVIVEQSGTTPFNRAMLFNIGYKEALKFQDFDCFIFHDVDLIPEDDRNMYTCPTSPRHLSVAVDKFNYVLPYSTIFGGAGAFKKDHFEGINGFSNKFWGWGGEDDDLYNRIAAKGYKLTRPAVKLARYKMIKVFHLQSSGADPDRIRKLRDSSERMKTDGLNSLVYTVLKVTEAPMYTMVTVEVDRKLV